jgi:hypothetical protein
VRATNVRNASGADKTARIGLHESAINLIFIIWVRWWSCEASTHHFSLVLLDELFVQAHVHEDLDGSLAHGITAVLVARELLLLKNERLFRPSSTTT